jgi:ABC-type xylose transport system permease subunit
MFDNIKKGLSIYEWISSNWQYIVVGGVLLGILFYSGQKDEENNIYP